MSLFPIQNKIVIGLTIGAAIVMIVLAVAANYGYRKAMPLYPDIEREPTDTVEAKIANYKALSEVVEKEETFLYDLIVVKVLQPLFVLLIGSIAGIKLLEALTNYIRASNDKGK